jgi:MFS transporter, AAHS family, 3-hydroxyphenylpropionic acid transporter
VAPVLFLLLPRSSSKVQKKSEPSAGKLNVMAGLFGEGQFATTIFLWTATFGTLLVMYLLVMWMPSLVKAMKFTDSQAQYVQMIYNIGSSVGAATAGYLLDRKLLYSTPAVAYVALGALLAVFGFATPGFEGALVLACGVGAAVTTAQAILYAFAPLCYPPSMRNSGVGAAVAAGRLGTIAGPLLAGSLLGAGKSAADVLIVLVPVTLVSGMMALLVVRMFKTASSRQETGSR